MPGHEISKHPVKWLDFHTQSFRVAGRAALVWDAPEMAKQTSLDDFKGEGGWSGLGLAIVAVVTLALALLALYIASPNVNPH
jgi:hypothetical protein